MPPPVTAPRRATARAVLVAYMALLTALSHQSSLPAMAEWFPHQDKVEHFLAYAVLGLLAHRAWPGAPPRRRWLFAALLGAGFGVADELHQALVPGRDASALDWLADGLGAASGALAGYFGAPRKNVREPLKDPAPVADP